MSFGYPILVQKLKEIGDDVNALSLYFGSEQRINTDGNCYCNKPNISSVFNVQSSITGTVYGLGCDCILRFTEETYCSCCNEKYVFKNWKQLERNLCTKCFRDKNKKEKIIKNLTETILDRGKYEGKSFQYVYDNHKKYCDWLIENNKSMKKFISYIKSRNS